MHVGLGFTRHRDRFDRADCIRLSRLLGEHAAERQNMDNTKDDAKRRVRTLHTIGYALPPLAIFCFQIESRLNHTTIP